MYNALTESELKYICDTKKDYDFIIENILDPVTCGMNVVSIQEQNKKIIKIIGDTCIECQFELTIDFPKICDIYEELL